MSCSKFLRAHFVVCRRKDNSDSWVQEHEGHTLSIKTLRSHLLENYTVFNELELRLIMVSIVDNTRAKDLTITCTYMYASYE